MVHTDSLLEPTLAYSQHPAYGPLIFRVVVNNAH